MNELENIMKTCFELNQKSNNLCETTILRHHWYLKSFLKFGSCNGFTRPCQKLYDDFILAGSNGYDAILNRKWVVKLVDEVASTNALDQDGYLLNLPNLYTYEEVTTYFKNFTFPLDDSADNLYLISYTLYNIKNEDTTQSTYGQYKKAYLYIYSWLISHKNFTYDEEVLNSFLKDNQLKFDTGLLKKWVYKIRKRALNILIEVANSGTYHWHIFKSSKIILDEDLQIIIQDYMLSMNNNNMALDTVNLYYYVFKKMMIYLNVKKSDDLLLIIENDIEMLCEKVIKDFTQSSLKTIYPIVKKILLYLYNQGYMIKNFSAMIQKPLYLKSFNPSIISKDDELKLIAYLDKISYRDQAIMLLAIRYGLRDSDICNLKFDEIDWYRDQIKITQTKTNVYLTLPLLDDVGNAIFNYLENERPECNTPYIFIRKQKPYHKIKSAYNLCSRIFEKLNITPLNGKGKGTHVFRYSLVKRLLDMEVPYQIITDSLGHVNKDSDKYYYSLDSEKLRSCCLDARWIGIKSWM